MSALSKIYFYIILFSFLFLNIAIAQVDLNFLSDYIIQFVIFVLIAPAFAIVFLVFIFNIFSYLRSIQKGSAEKASEDAKKYLLYPLVGIFLLTSLFTIIWVFRNIFLYISS